MRAPSGILNMRLSHPFILSGLPRDVTLLGSDDSGAPSGARKAHSMEHLSTDLLWSFVKSGRPLDDVYVRHANECRDCRDFVKEFSVDARVSGYSFPDLLPIANEKRISQAG